MLYCLDSNIIIDIFRGDIKLKEKLKELLKEQDFLCTTPIVLCELFKGAFLAKNKEQAINLVENFLHNTEIIEFDKNTCRIFGKIYSELQKKGKQTQEFDLMIASTAIAHEATLITKNYKDFENINGLKIADI